MMNRFCFLLSAVLFVPSCTVAPIPDELKNHIVAVHRDGELVKSNYLKANFHRTQPQRIEQLDTIVSEIGKFNRQADGFVHVLIYVHGGLNTKNNSTERVKTNVNELKDRKIYPIFVNWRSGPITTYSSHLTRIREGKFSSTAPFTSPLYFVSDLARVVANAPVAWLTTGIHSVKATLNRDFINERNTDLNQYSNGEHNIFFKGGHKNVSRLKRAGVWLATSPAKIVTTPLTYTLARPAWDVMLRRTNTPFVKNDEFHNEIYQIQGIREEVTHEGALWQFLLRLKKIDGNVKITIVGHSMGAIIANKILEYFPDLPYENVVHMASAASMRDTLNTTISLIEKRERKHKDLTEQRDENCKVILKHIEQQNCPLKEVSTAGKFNFYSLSLHPNNEDREESVHGLMPSGSLLVWIDSMYTTPQTHLDRTAGRWDNINLFKHMVPQAARKRVYFKVFGIEPDNKQSPQKHGEFGSGDFWDSKFWWGGPKVEA